MTKKALDMNELFVKYENDEKAVAQLLKLMLRLNRPSRAE